MLCYNSVLWQINTPDTSGFAAALAAAEAADYVVLMLGLDLTVGMAASKCTLSLSSECTEDEGRDRHNITLPGVQEQLAQLIIGTGKPTVVVLINGGIIAIDWCVKISHVFVFKPVALAYTHTLCMSGSARTRPPSLKLFTPAFTAPQPLSAQCLASTTLEAKCQSPSTRMLDVMRCA